MATTIRGHLIRAARLVYLTGVILVVFPLSAPVFAVASLLDACRYADACRATLPRLGLYRSLCLGIEWSWEDTKEQVGDLLRFYRRAFRFVLAS